MTQVLFLISSMESLQSRLSSNPYRNISTLLELAKEEYGIAIKGDVVVDVSEYQDSYGFILEAKQQSRLLEPTDATAVLSMLEEIQALWIDGVSTPIKATPVPSVAETIEAAIQKLGQSKDYPPNKRNNSANEPEYREPASAGKFGESVGHALSGVDDRSDILLSPALTSVVRVKGAETDGAESWRLKKIHA